MLNVHIRKTNETQNNIKTIDNSEPNNMYMNAVHLRSASTI